MVLVVAIGSDGESHINAVNTVAKETEKIAHSIYDRSDNSEDGLLTVGNSGVLVIKNSQINIDVVEAKSATPAYSMADTNATLVNSNKTTKTTTNGNEEAPSTFKTVLKYGLAGFGSYSNYGSGLYSQTN